ncbi:MAG: EamA family transporter [Gammaproteobacteria bacterium]|nr:EamA family transporter [Gammaproteobacteria bacterium]
MRTSVASLTTLAMIAFAANSLLCRLALGPGLIDAPSFATLRVLAGALTLGLIVAPRWRAEHKANTNFFAVAALLGYMICFSYAYLSLAAGTGALILFGTVQLTMFVAALRAGEPFSPLAWLGLSAALAGLVYLVSPGLTAPDPLGAVLMTGAGLGWGLYSLSGRTAPDALIATATNFVWTLPGVALVSLLTIADSNATSLGVTYAIASGAIASGLGYVIWFAAVKQLRATTAATVQLSVPIIAAFGGTLLLDEAVTLRLLIASAATLGGIWLVLAQKGKTA